MLSGLWEFPNLDGHQSEEELRNLMISSGLTLSSLVRIKNAKHIFSHIEWHMIGYLAVVDHNAPIDAAAEDMPLYGALPGFYWVGVERLNEHLALPAAFKAYYQIMKRYIAEGVTE